MVQMIWWLKPASLCWPEKFVSLVSANSRWGSVSHQWPVNQVLPVLFPEVAQPVGEPYLKFSRWGWWFWKPWAGRCWKYRRGSLRWGYIGGRAALFSGLGSGWVCVVLYLVFSRWGSYLERWGAWRIAGGWVRLYAGGATVPPVRCWEYLWLFILIVAVW